MTATFAPGLAGPALRARLEQIVDKSRVLDGPAERIAHSADASFYRLIPKAIVLAESPAEGAALFALSHELGIPITFRAVDLLSIPLIEEHQERLRQGEPELGDEIAQLFRRRGFVAYLDDVYASGDGGPNRLDPCRSTVFRWPCFTP